MPSKKPAKVKPAPKKMTKTVKAAPNALRRVADAAKKLVAKKPTPKLAVKVLAKAPGKSGKLPAKGAVPIKTPAKAVLKVVPKAATKAETLPKTKAKDAVAGKKAPALVVAKADLKKSGPAKEVDSKNAKAPKGKVVAVEVSSTVAVKKAKGSVPVKTVKEFKKRCRESSCDQEIILAGFCRLHYIKNWRKIKRKEAILATGQLNNYVEELVSKYPDKYLDVIRQDLGSEKDWSKVVVDLELDSTEDEFGAEEDESPSAEGGGRHRDFDDDSDSF
jgi:hypothetical protein